MSVGGLTLVVTARFMDRVAEVEQYLGRENPAAGRAFVTALFDFLYEAIEPFPLAFPAYSLPKHPAILLRRAVFRRHYNVVYEVMTTEVRCLTFFATAQDAGRIDL